jgi:hypothetical protein
LTPNAQFPRPNRPQFRTPRRLLFALRAHETLPPAVPMAFGVTFDQSQEQFREYVIATLSQS